MVSNYPITVPIGITIGYDFSFVGVAYDNSVTPRAAYDFTDHSAEFRLMRGDTEVFADGLTLDDEGNFSVLIPRTTTADLEACDLRYIVSLTMPSGTIVPWLAGKATVIEV